MQNNTSSRPSSASGFRPSTASQPAMTNVKLQAAIEKYGSFANAMESVSSAEFASKLVQVWAGFNDRCRYLDSRISPTGNLSWTEVKSVFSYLHIQKMATERCLRNLFSDLGMQHYSQSILTPLTFTQASHSRMRIMLFRSTTQHLSKKSGVP